MKRMRRMRRLARRFGRARAACVVLLLALAALRILDPAPLEEVARLGGNVKLIPGMPVEAFVQTGDRTMLSYLMKPLSDQLMRAFREK